MIGKPGAGKSTVSKRLLEKKQLGYFSTGDIFRGLADNSKHPLAKKVKEILANGEFVDDETVLELVRHELDSVDLTGKEGVLVDGFPRTEKQLALFKEKVDKPYKFLYCSVDTEVAVKRLLDRKEDRADDNEETIKTRVREFEERTVPVIRLAAENNKLFEIDNSSSFQELHQKLDQIINKLFV